MPCGADHVKPGRTTAACDAGSLLHPARAAATPVLYRDTSCPKSVVLMPTELAPWAPWPRSARSARASHGRGRACCVLHYGASSSYLRAGSPFKQGRGCFPRISGGCAAATKRWLLRGRSSAKKGCAGSRQAYTSAMRSRETPAAAQLHATTMPSGHEQRRSYAPAGHTVTRFWPI